MYKDRSGLGIQDRDEQTVAEQQGTEHRNSGSGSEADQHNNVTTSPWRGAVRILVVLVRENKSTVRTLHSPECP